MNSEQTNRALTLALCREPITVTNASRTLKITESEKVLLTLLALWPSDHFMPYSTLSHWLPRGRTVTAAKQAVLRLRQKLRTAGIRHLIDIAAYGNRCRLNRTQLLVDADQILLERQSLIGQWRQFRQSESTPSSAAQLWIEFHRVHTMGIELPTRLLNRGLADWRVDTDDEEEEYRRANSIIDDWQEMYVEFDLAFAEISFAAGNAANYPPAFKALKSLVTNNSDPPDLAWELLIGNLRLYSKQDFHHWVLRYVKDCQEAERQPSPRIVTDTDLAEAERLTQHEAERNTQASQLDPDDALLLRLARLLGIMPCREDAMAEGRMSPASIIQKQPVQLLFAGTLATQWVDGRNIRLTFDRYLSTMDAKLPTSHRLDDEETPIRFLIMDPYGTAFAAFNEERSGRVSIDHIPTLVELSEKHPCFQIRTFEAKPQFRLQVMDFGGAAMASFARYPRDIREFNQSNGGLATPHFVARRRSGTLAAGDDDLLADLIRHCFEAIWRGATPLAIPKGG